MSCFRAKYLVVCFYQPCKILVVTAGMVHLTRMDGYFRCLASVFEFIELAPVRQKTSRIHVMYEEHNNCILRIVEENL
jgi:hypothetical protein